MAGYTHKWYQEKMVIATRVRAIKAVNGAASDTVLLCQSPAPVGWTRVTGFLAGSTQPEYAESMKGDMITARVVARANYAIHQHRRQPVLAKNGDEMAKTIGNRIKKA